MKKFYSVNNYAKLKGVDESTIREWSKKHQIKPLIISQALNEKKLIVEDDNTGANIVSLMNFKGGSTKTTTAVHLSILLAKLKYKVLLIDTDHQNQCLLFFPPQENQHNNTIVDLIQGKNINECITTIRGHDYEIDIIFSDYNLVMLATDIKSYDWLREKLELVRKNYDFIILDTSPSFYNLERNVARASTNIVVPLVPESLNVSGLVHYFQGLESITEIPLDRITGILISRYENVAQHKFYVKELQSAYNGKVFESIIPKDTNLPKTVDFRTNIFDYREKSKASQLLKKFTWELLQRL